MTRRRLKSRGDFLLEKTVHGLRVRPARGFFHHRAHQGTQGALVAAFSHLPRPWIGPNGFLHHAAIWLSSPTCCKPSPAQWRRAFFQNPSFHQNIFAILPERVPRESTNQCRQMTGGNQGGAKSFFSAFSRPKSSLQINWPVVSPLGRRDTFFPQPVKAFHNKIRQLFFRREHPSVIGGKACSFS